MPKRSLLAAIVPAVLLLTLVGCGTGSNSSGASNSSTAGKTVVLKGVTSWTKSTKDTTGFFYLQNEVNTKGAAQGLSIKYLGGPEVVPTFQLANALKSGTVDIVVTSMSYEASLAPETNAFTMDMHTPAKERADGYYALFNKILAQKCNAILLGRANPGQAFHLYTTFPVHSIADFKGKPLRTAVIYTQLMKDLGASPVTLAPGDVYSALDRGVVQGYAWPGYGIEDQGWDAKTKDEINPGFDQVDAVILMNLDKYNSLTDAQKKILNDAAIDMENAMDAQFKQFVSTSQAKLAKEGIKTVNLPAQQFNDYVKNANKTILQQISKQSPVFGPQIEKLIYQ